MIVGRTVVGGPRPTIRASGSCFYRTMSVLEFRLMRMTDDAKAIEIFETEDGMFVFGSEDGLAVIDKEPGVVSRVMSRKSLASAVGYAGPAAAALMEGSGRYVKLTADSAVARKAAALVDPANATSGVLRDGGKIAKHLKFENVALLTPAAPAMLGAMATQQALEASLAEITAYLEVIDAKLDQLLKQNETKAIGQLGGVTFVIEEAKAIFDATGVVSEVTWSKVQGTSLALPSMQAEAIAQLHQIADDINSKGASTDKLAETLKPESVVFWLEVLARTISLQDEQYVLELARVLEVDATQVELHQKGIRTARADRLRRLTEGLEVVLDAIGVSGQVSHRAIVANPINAPKVVRAANEISTAIRTFAAHASLELKTVGALEETRWSAAAVALAGEGASAVGSARQKVTGTAGSLKDTLVARKEEAALRKAEKIKEKRRLRGQPQADDVEE